MLKKEEIDNLYDRLSDINDDTDSTSVAYDDCLDDLFVYAYKYQDLCDDMVAMLYKAESEQSK